MKVERIVEAALDLSHRLREQSLFAGGEAITIGIQSRAWPEFIEALITSHLWSPMPGQGVPRVISLGFVTFEVVG